MESLSKELARPDYDHFQPEMAARIKRSRVWRFGLARALGSGPTWSQLLTAWRLLRGR